MTVLDLSNHESQPWYDHGHLVQKEAVRRIIELLPPPEKFKITPSDPSWDEKNGGQALKIKPQHTHDVITVSAKRGWGKTSLIATILHALETRKDWDELREAAGLPKDDWQYTSLGIIDPTLIERKQHIMLLIIQRIDTAVRECCVCPGRDSHTYKAFEARKLELAECVTVLDGVGGNHLEDNGWAEPEFVLDTGLTKAGAAADFERRFGKYIEAALRVLNKQAFVLAIDDIDTRFEQGWPVLEALRKYLTSPNLRIIVSGDINLFSLLVRKEQWHQMRGDLLEMERWFHKHRSDFPDRSSRMPQIEVTIDQLEMQYIIKVLRSEKRINLKSLKYYADHQDNDSKILFATSANQEGVAPEALLERYAQRIVGYRNKSVISDMIKFLLNEAIRGTIQVLRMAEPAIKLPKFLNRPGIAGGSNS